MDHATKVFSNEPGGLTDMQKPADKPTEKHLLTSLTEAEWEACKAHVRQIAAQLSAKLGIEVPFSHKRWATWLIKRELGIPDPLGKVLEELEQQQASSNRRAA